VTARRPEPLDVPDDGPNICPAHGLPFCDACTEDVAHESELTRTVCGPHPITGDVVTWWVCASCAARECEEGA
jgi:hypothetical protein